jgi:predicted AAA+ superfamily ATPase
MERIRLFFPFEMERRLIKEILLDQRAVFEKKRPGTPRDALAEVGRHMGKPHAITLAGVRRCGKSTLLRQIAERFLATGYHYCHFEDERLLGFQARDFALLYEVLIECFGEHKVMLLDEVQNAPGWEAFVRRMLESGHKFIITGSNAALLSRELGSKLTGRHVTVDLFPFSFREYLRHLGVEPDEAMLLRPAGRATLARHLAEYRLRGGFPEPLVYDSPDLLAQLYDDILYRDVATRHDIKNTHALRELALYYMSNVATLASFNKLKSSLGLGSVTTVSAYTDFLVRAFVLATVPVYDASVKRRSVAPKKVYAVDTGLANRVSLSFSHNLGALTENLVFLELFRRGADVSYYRTASGREVDFACRRGRALDELVQVTLSLADPQVRTRELGALTEALDEQDRAGGLVLTESDREDIALGKRTIKVRPLAGWLCGLDA